MFQLIADAIRDAWQSFANGLVLFLPRLFAMLVIVALGWLLAWCLGWLTRRLLGWLRVQAVVERAGGREMLHRIGLPSAERVVGALVYWIVLAAFLLSGLEALGVTGMELVVADFLRFVPRIIVAVVILALGFGVATFAWRATLLAAANASVPWARALSELVRFMILTLTVAMALEQIAVAHSVVLTAFAITFGAVMVGIAIAIGVGGSGVVRRFLERRLGDPPPPGSDSRSHL